MPANSKTEVSGLGKHMKYQQGSFGRSFLLEKVGLAMLETIA
jgi:hypothetical protein